MDNLNSFLLGALLGALCGVLILGCICIFTLEASTQSEPQNVIENCETFIKLENNYLDTIAIEFAKENLYDYYGWYLTDKGILYFKFVNENDKIYRYTFEEIK